jgi:tryptophanyl-tRNA synthetase
MKAHYRRGGLGDVKVKRFLINVLEDLLVPIRERRNYWEAQLPEVIQYLEESTKIANEKANRTVERVRAAMRINYFDGDAFLQEALERYPENK